MLLLPKIHHLYAVNMFLARIFFTTYFKRGQLVFLPRTQFQCLCSHKCTILFQGGEQLFLYVTVFDGQVTSKTEVWARIRSSSATPDSTEINNERPPPGATAYLPNSHFQFPGGGSSGGSNIPPGFIQPPPPIPEINRKPRPPPPPPPPPQTTQRAATVQEHARGACQLPLIRTSVVEHWYKELGAIFQQYRLQRQRWHHFQEVKAHIITRPTRRAQWPRFPTSRQRWYLFPLYVGSSLRGGQLPGCSAASFVVTEIRATRMTWQVHTLFITIDTI